MSDDPSRRSILTATAAVGLLTTLTTTLAQPIERRTPAMQAVLDYAQSQNTTGFLIVRDRKTLVEKNWPLPPDAEAFQAAATYGTTADGALLEDVASQQKSFVSVLVGIAIDKGLLDATQTVSAISAPAGRRPR